MICVETAAKRQRWPRPTASSTSDAWRQNILYSCGNCALPAWRDFVAVTDYGQPNGEGISPWGGPPNIFVAISAFNEGPTLGSVVLPAKQHAAEGVGIDRGAAGDTPGIASLPG